MNYNPKLMKYYEDYLKKNNIYTEEKYNHGLKELEKGRPIQYIIGNVDFYGNIIKVNESVLIPRFETELLVEKTIRYIQKIFKNQSISIIDLGTGSGCIAITIKKMLPNSRITAIDISDEALEIAKENAKINKVKIDFIKKDMTEKLTQTYDVIISNPPYISYDEEIMDIVKENEPQLALYAEEKGTYYYHQILKNLADNLPTTYLIAFEIGYKQAQTISSLAKKYLNNPNIIIEEDYNQKNRYIFITNNKKTML